MNRGGVQNAVYLMGAHGTNIHAITPTGLRAVDADWSPDGSRIAFWTHCCNVRPSAIGAVKSDGSGLQQLTFPIIGSDIRPSYSPQGDKIAFEHDSADFSTSSVVIMNPDGTDQTTIQADAYSPFWGTARP